jgi:hypothetical protein
VVVVTPIDTILARIQAEKDNAKEKEKLAEVLDYLKRTGELTGVNLDEKYVYESGTEKVNQGFFIDTVLKKNLDNYLVRAVDNLWDGIFILTGMEGAGKSTMAAALCKYLDPSFPGEPLNDGTARRHCDRVVFTPAQFSEAVAKSKPKQAIQFDEAILGLMAGDAGTNVQRMLMKEITLIRKKQLYIVLVIPSIFSMRMPIAAQRSRFLIHTYSPDGIRRGYFKFYNYPTKRHLYIKGKKDFNQDAVEANFRGTFTNTEGLFFSHDEYDKKKERAIRSLSDINTGKKNTQMTDASYRTTGQRNLLLFYLYSVLGGDHNGKEQLEHLIKLHNEYVTANKGVNSKGKLTPPKFSEWLEQVFGEHMKMHEASVRGYLKDAIEFTSKPLNPLGTENKEEVEQYEE